MLRFSANISLMFTEHRFLDRFTTAANAGFEAVEFLFPYDYAPDEIAREITSNQLEVSVFNLFPGNWENGDRGFAAIVGQEQDFARSVDQAIPYALATGAKRLHVMAGLSEAETVAEDVFVKNLQKAADTFARFDLEAMIEPINQGDMPGYFLSSTDRALSLLERIDRLNVGLQFDVYHHQITHGDAAEALAANLRHIRHIQIAGVPDRHEPDAKAQLYREFFKVLQGDAYKGWIGCEYRPKGNTMFGLDWMREIEGELD